MYALQCRRKVKKFGGQISFRLSILVSVLCIGKNVPPVQAVTPIPTPVPPALQCVVLARQASVDTGRIALTKKN
jgi:hypothetical protein